MRKLARFSIANSAFNHVLTALIIAVGVYSLITIPQELNRLSRSTTTSSSPSTPEPVHRKSKPS